MKKILSWLFEPLHSALFRFMVLSGMILCVVDPTDPVDPDADPVDPDADPVDPDADPVDPDADPVDPDADPVDPDADPVDPPATKQSRGQARIQRLAERTAEAEAEAKALREQAEFFRRQAEQLSQQQQQRPQQDDVYVDPDEKWRRETEQRVNHALFSAQDMQDKAAYTLQATKNPLYVKYQDRVEEHLQKARAAGNYAATRDGILSFLIGEDVKKNAGKPTSAARAAQQRVAAAKTTTPGVKSNVPAPRKEQSAEERLRGVIL